MPLLTLALLLAAQPDTATISGAILDSVTRQPVPAAKVVLMRQGRRGLFSDTLIANAELKSDDPAARFLAALTNPQGQFSFTVAAPVSFMLYVKCEGDVNGQLLATPGPVLQVTPGHGHSALTGLAPGDYVIALQPPPRKAFQDGGAPEQFRALTLRGYPPTYYPGVDRREQSSPVTLLAGAHL